MFADVVKPSVPEGSVCLPAYTVDCDSVDSSSQGNRRRVLNLCLPKDNIAVLQKTTSKFMELRRGFDSLPAELRRGEVLPDIETFPNTEY